MFTAKIQNASGQLLTLTGNESDYQLTAIDGLNPPQATINLATIPNMDGGLYNSARLEPRNIVLSIYINGDVETNRLNLYKYFRVKDWCKFYYQNGTLNTTIEGYVDNIECDLFSKNEMAQISITCPDPWFKGSDHTTTIATTGTTTITNTSDSDCPALITATVINTPSTAIDFFYVENGNEMFGLSDISFVLGDVITINSATGKKSARLTHNGTTTSIIGNITSLTTSFLNVARGANTFSYGATGVNRANIEVKVKYTDLYRGV